MRDQVVIPNSPTAEILALNHTKVSDYIRKKRINQELGGIIAKLNHELIFGSKGARHDASSALEKLGYVLD